MLKSADGQLTYVHAAVKELRSAVKGFWVEMPLDWIGLVTKT
jgi:hypothetical protein